MILRDELIALGIPIPENFSLDWNGWAAKLQETPLRNTTALVGLSAVLFFLAERGRNPKVNDITDAMVYCSTCLSVGYADIFAKTPIGKLIGTFLMTIGPAMTSKALDGPEQNRRDAVQEETLVTLKQILGRMEEQRV